MYFLLCRRGLAAVIFACLSWGAQAQPTRSAPNSGPAARPPAEAPQPVDDASDEAPAPAASATAQPTPEPPAGPSPMSAQLFYEVLSGELNLQAGDRRDGLKMLFEAARNSGDADLYTRAVDAAVQARRLDTALDIIQSWRRSAPSSTAARRAELQVLLALGRISETGKLLREELAVLPVVERPAFMAAIARAYGRASDKKQAADVVQEALADDLANPATAALAWTTVGRLRMLAGDSAAALDAAQRGQAAKPDADGPVVLAMDLIDRSRPQAEEIVRRYLAGPSPLPEARIAYARVLAQDQRYAEAREQMLTLTRERPAHPEAWLLLGTLQVQAKDERAAEASLQRYLDLAGKGADAEERARGMGLAYSQLATLAERRKDFAGADRWLSRIDNPEQLAAAQTRRAVLLARQGKLAQARQMIAALPERSAEDRKQKLGAEVELLREAKDEAGAYALLAKASAAAPADTDLAYDAAMSAEKIGRTDEMERLLRTIMSAKPDNAHAYNALGYSLAERNERLPEARELIEKAVKLAPDDPFIADSLGWVEYRMGRMDEARRILEEAYKKRPDPEIGAHLGEVLWVAGQRDRALVVWKEALAADPDNATLKSTLKRFQAKP